MNCIVRLMVCDRVTRKEICFYSAIPLPINIQVLSFSLPASYPSLSPPTYSYSAPFLGPRFYNFCVKYFPNICQKINSYLSREKAELEAELDSVYLENIGEDILFLWVEKVDCISLNPDPVSSKSLFSGTITSNHL